jgi:5-methylcytosine-specific restriction protein B
MNLEELSTILKDMYENTQTKEQVVNIHMFGIKYADTIKKNNIKISKLIEASGMKKSYAIEVSKGIKQSEFVKLK